VLGVVGGGVVVGGFFGVAVCGGGGVGGGVGGGGCHSLHSNYLSSLRCRVRFLFVLGKSQISSEGRLAYSADTVSYIALW